ncbi:UTP--glucose-1-phosphate uridylyltransferase [Myxococcota bacterium]|nr:UTP--glucose-1-phosphate uridylyltransferase [Myxococcota bacterium]
MTHAPAAPTPEEIDLRFAPFERMMRAEGLPDLAIASFRRHYRMLSDGDTGVLREADIRPVDDLPDAERLDPALEAVGRAALPQAVMLKLNGGLGTGMGLEKAKSLLPVRGALTFLDLIARQADAASVPLVLMDSFATRDDSLAALAAWPRRFPDLPQDFVQHKVPKVDQATLAPAEWPEEDLRWCPPGHGDLYTALVTSGALDALLAAGRRFAFVSNSDNVGASLDPTILGHLVARGLPFLMEVCDRTSIDRKGGHLCWQGDRLALREAAQCAPQDQDAFQDVTRHRYFNTNNIWLDLRALRALLDQGDGVVALPLIRNAKTVDPRDPVSTPVYQLESAMGAAISTFPGAAALRVPRSRFVPVKTTADLLRARSDAMTLTEDARLVSALPPDRAPVDIVLDGRFYKLVDQLDARFPHGPPSLVDCSRLVVEGDVRFGEDVRCRGEVRIRTEAGAGIPAHAELRGEYHL